jgi:predicted metal-binding membrane protein
VGVAALLFAGSAALTIAWPGPMAAMGSMPLCGDGVPWPVRTWMPWPVSPGAMATFMGMWTAMMTAMMLPSLAPLLWRYRQAYAGAGAVTRANTLAAVVGMGYFAVWAALGVPAYAVISALPMLAADTPALARVLPFAVFLAAAVLQFSAWKARHLACWGRVAQPGCAFPARPATAWRHGLRAGWHCACCSAGPTAILLVTGVMDLRVMAAVTAVVTAERLLRRPERYCP